MRRGFSILLVLLFGLGPLSAIAGSEDAGLPPCCRRHGAHHCAMAVRMAAKMRQAEPGSTAAVSSPLTCPGYPGMSAMFTALAAAVLAAAASLPAIAERAFATFAVRTIVPSAPSSDHAGRGPPSANLS